MAMKKMNIFARIRIKVFPHNNERVNHYTTKNYNDLS